jgi:hypothetical protein
MDPVTLAAVVVIMVLGAAMSGASVSFDSGWLLFGALALGAAGLVIALAGGA